MNSEEYKICFTNFEGGIFMCENCNHKLNDRFNPKDFEKNKQKTRPGSALL